MAKNDSNKASTTAADKAVLPEDVAGVDVNAIAQALAAPFDVSEVKFKPQTVSGNRALAVPFVDARVIQDRLDDVLGVMGWQDSYECLPDGAVVCRLRIRLGAEWITKEDVGGQSEQPDEGDRRKAAFSDALKRAAVKFGIGRYLYRLKPQWVDYDPQKRRFLQTPALPSSALPPPSGNELKQQQATTARLHEPAPAQAPAPEKKGSGRGSNKATAAVARAPAPAATVEAKAPASGGGRGKPANGTELQRRLYDKDAQLAQEGLSRPGDLVKHIVQAGQKAGYEADLATWNDEKAIDLAIAETLTFQKQRTPRKEVA